jgi:nicotinamide-nucleotide amidase
MPSAEIIAIGTELLLGEILDTNTRYIALILRELGIDLFRTTIVGDNKDRISAVVREAMTRSEIIITTGGLGPTVDDPTREALAQAANVPLEFHPELWESISARISKFGRPAGENQKRQAYIPQNSIIIQNPVGTAPAFIVPTNSNKIISLPGVPAEMKTLLDLFVIPYLKEHYPMKETIKVRVLHTSGAGEGWIDEKISDLELLSNPTVGLAAHAGLVDIRISAKASNETEAFKLIDNLEIEIRKRLGNFIFGTDTDQLENVTMDLFTHCGWNLFCIEFGTDGLLDVRLSSINNSSYLEGPKKPITQIKIEPILQMITKYKGKADVIIGLSVITIAGESHIDLAIITPEKEYDHQLIYTGHPENAPILAVNLALDRLRRLATDSLESRKKTISPS